MNRFFSCLLCLLMAFSVKAQTPKTYTSSEILQQLKKLNVLGSVLYIAAHPDDENTRLLAYLANEKLYRTGYLSLTRGDGGQNLIGDEQGIDLGLIRTQELLAARRIDGAEQFFSRAYDFGFCKSPEEALATWGHDKILSDAVWVIRKFKPDVIIARFPEDSRAGHGHHAASGIIAREAFDAAADSTRFPEQLKQGVTVWQAKRMLWNTFNFGGNSTQNESQFKVEVGMYNPLLGKSYGEIAALSRSQHKSQGFGVPAQRGTVVEYFETIKGDKPVNDLMEGIDLSWSRQQLSFANIKDDSLRAFIGKALKGVDFKKSIDSLISNYMAEQPEKSLPLLMELAMKLKIASTGENNFWSRTKLEEATRLIELCSGLFMEATAVNQLNPIGDSIKINVTVNNRLGVGISKIVTTVSGRNLVFATPGKNVNVVQSATGFVSKAERFSQPYWLEWDKTPGAFTVHEQNYIGQPQLYPYQASFDVHIGSDVYTFIKPVQYKYTDPIKGELYQPIQIVEPLFINSQPSLIIFKNGEKNQKARISYTIQSNLSLKDTFNFKAAIGNRSQVIFDSVLSFSKTDKRETGFLVNSDSLPDNSSEYISAELAARSLYEHQYFSLRKISYDHIPDIYYNYIDGVKVLKLDLKTKGSAIGYIAGAGDKVPQALEQMGYKVTLLKEADITSSNLKQFDAVITGVRAYNTNDWMINVYDALMQYVNEGGVLVTQYNTSNFISNVKGKIGPYPFSISRNRITDENAKVNFLLPDHPLLNYPNKITDKDFEGWIQERSVYHAEKIDSNYQRIISMKDPGEKEDDGSLIVANYGKGRFVYTGLVFFRELPAGVPGAYRLLANLIAPSQTPGKSSSGKQGSKKSLPNKTTITGKTNTQ